MKKIIVTGGRDYFNKEKIYSILDHFNPDVIIHGDCSGVDTISKNWAIERGKEQIPYPYPSEYGKAGGPIRNRQMCREHQDAKLVAFPGGRGTASCKKEAKLVNIPIYEVL